MKTYDMKRTDKEKKAATERMMEPMSQADDYPHGMRLSLDEPTMRKIGLDPDDLPRKGDKFKIGGGATVHGVTDGMYGGGPEMSLILHEFGVEKAPQPGGQEKSIRDELEDARHQARGTTAPAGRIGARQASNGDDRA